MSLPVPPAELVARIGGTRDDYVVIAGRQREILESLLPSDWSFAGKSVLDLGCGTGRTLCTFSAEAENGDFVGCDIHAESIEWARSELSPPFDFFVCDECPPLAQPDQRFDLVFGMSVFSHITDQWSRWLVEIHRVMRPGGLAVISVLGPTVAARVLGIDWDERIGMASIDFHKGWEIGGPSTLLAEWWVREHWGRAFEVLRFECPDEWYAHDFAVMRRREVSICPSQLEAVDRSDPREYDSLIANLEILQQQQKTLGTRLRDEQLAQTAQVQRLTDEIARQQDDIQRLTTTLNTITTSRSWRLTTALRQTKAALEKLR